MKIVLIIILCLMSWLPYNLNAAISCSDVFDQSAQALNVDFGSRIQNHVIEFLKRQVNYDKQILAELSTIITKATNKNPKGLTTLNLQVLVELRQVLEKNHAEFLLTRKIHGKNRLARRIMELTEFVKKFEYEFKTNTSILDVGAGNGQILSGFAKSLGVDGKNIFALELADYSNRARDVQWINYNVKGNIPLENNSVDLINIMMVFHHAPDPQHLIQEVFRVLQSGGQVIVRETDAGDQKSLGLNSSEVISLNQILDNMLYVVFDPNSGVPMMNNYQPRSFWRNLFLEAGFQVEEFESMEPGSPFQPVYFHLTKL